MYGPALPYTRRPAKAEYVLGEKLAAKGAQLAADLLPTTRCVQAWISASS